MGDKTLKFLWLFCAFVLFTSPAWAQTTLAVDINRAMLSWEWTPSTGGAVSEFRVKCGTVTGSYSKITILADQAARTMPVKNAIAGAGTWFCVATAANPFGESGPTNEVTFDAGVVPVSPANLSVQVQ